MANAILPDCSSGPLAQESGRAGSKSGRRLAPLTAFLAALAGGLVITLAQVGVACLMSGKPTFDEAYVSLARFDSGWYFTIVERGYYFPETPSVDDPGNVAFFPGYPLAAALVSLASGLPIEHSLLVTAQLACWGLWTYLLLLCRRWRLSLAATAAVAALVAAHPAAYYLVAGYSESLFLVNLVGFLYWSEKKGRAAAVAACVHGFLMTATRLVGLPVVIYPLVRAWLRRDVDGAAPAWRRLLVPTLVGAAASTGALSFFLFCQFRFGHWDAYMRAGHGGWGLGRRYLAPLSWRFYASWFRYRNPQRWMNQTATLMMQAALAALAYIEVRRARRNGRGWIDRAGLYVAAAFLWYVPICASYPGLAGMIRYGLCVQILLVLAAAHLVSRDRIAWPVRARQALMFAIIASFTYQLLLAYQFTHGFWVA